MCCISDFSNLPSPIISEILSRLPVKGIIQCKSVCKAWQKLVSQPQFINLHLSKSPTRLIINQSYTHPSDSNFFNLVEIEDDPHHHDLHYLPGTEIELPKSAAYMTMVGSINGLVCIREFGYQHDSAIICNPATRDHIILESPPGLQVFPNITTYGFGLSSIKGHYKVVRIFQERKEIDDDESNFGTRRIQTCKSECHIYTLGEGSWRNIGDAPFLYNCGEHGIFLNGNLHWLISDPDDGLELISCLDLEKELFQPFPAPHGLSQRNLATMNVYGESLCVCDNTSDFDIVILVMIEYGVKNSWRKEFVISKYPIDLVGDYYEVVHVIKVFKDGKLLLLWRDDLLLCYDPRDKSFSIIDSRELMGMIEKKTCASQELFYHYIEAMDYVPSLIPLKKLAMENICTDQ